jgi:hypothetical protein
MSNGGKCSLCADWYLKIEKSGNPFENKKYKNKDQGSSVGSKKISRHQRAHDMSEKTKPPKVH